MTEYELSENQKALWLLQKTRPADPWYIVSRAHELHGSLELDSLRAAVTAVCERHSVLGTRIRTRDTEDVASISAEAPDYAVLDLTALGQSVEQVVSTLAATPFDLDGPLLRVRLLKQNDQAHVLVVNVHHVIFDGWSLRVLYSDLSRAYNQRVQGSHAPDPALPFQFYDFDSWLDRQSWPSKLVAARRRHQDFVPFSLPLERSRAAADLSRGRREIRLLTAELVEALEDRAKEHDANLNMLLLTLCSWNLGRYGDSADVVLGMPVANRRGTTRLIGYFANVVPVQLAVPAHVPLAQAIRSTAVALAAAREAEDIPFETLVRELRVRREAGTNPLFQIAYAYQNAHSDGPELLEVVATPLPDERVDVPARFDLEMHFWTSESGAITLELIYAVEALGGEGMSAFTGRLIGLLERVAAGEVPVLEPSLLLSTADAAPTAPAVGLSPIELSEAAPSSPRAYAAAARFSEWHHGAGANLELPEADLDACFRVFEAAWHAQVPLAVERVAAADGSSREIARVLPRSVGTAPPLEATWDALNQASAAQTPLPGAGFSLQLGPCQAVASADSLRGRLARIASLLTQRDFVAVTPTLMSLTFPLAALATLCGLTQLTTSVAACVEGRRATRFLAAHELAASSVTPDTADDLLLHGPPLCSELGVGRLGYLVFCAELGCEIAHVGPGDSIGALSAGAPLWPLEIRDRDGQRLPLGFPGAVYVELPPALRPSAPGMTASAPWSSSGFSGRLSRAGEVSFLPAGQPAIELLRGVPIARAAIERALVEHAGVQACAVRFSGSGTVVCYLEVTSPLDRAALRSCVYRLLPSDHISVSFALLASLPVNANGELDEWALARIPVLEPDSIVDNAGHSLALFRRWRHNAPGDRVPFPTFAAQALPAPAGSASAGKGSDRVAEVATPQAFAAKHATLVAAQRDAAVQSARQRIVFVDAAGNAHMVGYERFFAKVQQHAHALRALGIEAGERVPLLFRSNEQFLTAFWSLLSIRAVPMLVSAPRGGDSSSAEVLRACEAVELSNARRVLSERDVASVLAIAFASRSLTAELVLLEEAISGCASVPLPECLPDDVALILLTSGSTGRPKQVPLTHKNVLAMIEGATAAHGFSRDDVTLNWMPLDHVGGIVFFHLRDTCLGVRQVHVAKEHLMAAPLQWLELMARHRVTVTWAPNSAYAMLNRAVEEAPPGALDLSCVRMLLNGGEAVVSKTARDTLRLLQAYGVRESAMVPVWGMSETSSGVIYSDAFSLESTSDDDAFVEVGAPLPGLAMRIVDAQGAPVAEGVTGSLLVRGACVFGGYEADPALTASSFAGDWFKTGDLGVIRDGRLTLVGREKDVIILNGVNRHGREFEMPASEVEGVNPALCVACGIPSARSGSENLVIFVALRADAKLEPAAVGAEIRRRVFTSTGVAPHAVIRLNPAEFPTTEIGKVQRSALVNAMRAGAYRSRYLAGAEAAHASEGEMLPDCIYRVAWERKALSARKVSPSKPQALLVVYGHAGADPGLWSQTSGECVEVVYATGGARSGDSRCLDPLAPGAFEALFASLEATGRRVSRVVDLSFAQVAATDDERELSDPMRMVALSRLAAALEARATVTSLSVVSARHARPSSWSWGSGGLRGLVRTMREECPRLRARLIELTDVAANDIPPLVHAEELAGGDVVVQYRGRSRTVPGLDKVWTGPAVRPESPFEPGGLYVVTGALGGIGSLISALLSERYRAKLLLLGRVGTLRDEQRRADVQTLVARLGSTSTLFLEASVVDPHTLEAAIRQAERHFSLSLAGVVHTAGSYRESPLSDVTPEALTEQFEAQVGGAAALAQALSTRPQASLLAFGSINGHFAAPSTALYSAATTALADVCEQLENAQRRVHCIGSTRWHSTGLARAHGSDNAVKSAGFEVLEPSEALRALQLVVTEPSGLYLVGINGRHARMRKFLEPGESQEEWFALQATLEEATEPPQARREPRTFLDASGLRVQLETWFCSPSEFHTALQDPAAAWTLARRSGRDEARSALTETEARLGEIWRELLGGAEVGRDSNFFEVGGDSLQGSQVVARIRAEYGVDVPLDKIFDLPRLRELALFVESVSEKR